MEPSKRTPWAHLAVIVALTLCIALYFIWQTAPETVRHFLLTIIVVLLVHLLDRVVLLDETRRALREEVRSGMESQTGEFRQLAERLIASLIRSVASLQTMHQKGIVRIYSSRAESAEDIHDDLLNPNNTEIQIAGISLNDFLRGDQAMLKKTWERLDACIRANNAFDQPHHLHIKLLLIDPECFGAHLRSRGEVRKQPAVPGRLSDDVKAVLTYLDDLQQTAEVNARQLAQEGNGTRGGVSFECRLYRIAPVLFLCRTDTVSYVQQYYFWSYRASGTPIPMLKFQSGAGAAESPSPHDEMAAHFEWIWKYASLPVTDYSQKVMIGRDRGLGECGLTSVYLADEEVRSRVKWLIEHAEKRVWIQGVSLRAFFRPGDWLGAISMLIKDSKVDLKLLLLDPECEQAMYRSYREEAYGKGVTLDTYRNDPKGHQWSHLYRETSETIKKVEDLVTECSASETIKKGWRNRVELGLYDSAPVCFMLMVDSTVLVEQYHYGKIEAVGRLHGTLLGKDMPLLEFSKEPQPLYEGMPLRNPFGLLENHFEFAFEQARKISLPAPTGTNAPPQPSPAPHRSPGPAGPPQDPAHLPRVP